MSKPPCRFRRARLLPSRQWHSARQEARPPSTEKSQLQASEPPWPTPRPNTSWGLRRQIEIYQAGLAGKTPAHPVSAEQLELEAKSVLKTEAFDYVAGGAGSEDTMRANRDAFRRWRIVPRFFRDVSRRDLGVEVLGVKLRAPIMLAPIGVQSILHKDGELAVARAARVARRADDPEHGRLRIRWKRWPARWATTPRWFQLYWPARRRAGGQLHSPRRAGGLRRDRGDARHLLARVARARHSERLPAVLSRRRAGELFQRPGLPPGRWGRSASRSQRGPSNISAQVFSDPSRTWDDLGRLCRSTRLPVVVKGVLHADDARRAVDQGVAGVIVSNHGGRQLDGALAALDALPASRRRRRRPDDGPVRQRHPPRDRRVQGDRAGSAGRVCWAGLTRSAWRSAANRACTTCSPT